MKATSEPTEYQLACPHENSYCSYAGEDGYIYTCPDCGLEWENEDNEVTENDSDFEDE